MNKTLLYYNALDSACTFEVMQAIKPDIDSGGYRWAYDFTLSLFDALMFMQTRGIKVDFSALEQTKHDIISSRDNAQAELNKICGFELNCNSPKQCAQYFYITKGITPYLNKSGGVTTDDKALQRIARGTAKRPGLREAHLVQEVRGYTKLYGTYLDIDFDQDGRLRCSYNPRGTKFGRLSSSGTVFRTGTNLQNLPQEFKKFLIPDEGYFFWEVDKRQAEWVVVAYLSGDANMLSVVESGKDPHTHTASLMFRLPEDLIKHDAKVIGNLSDPSEIYERRINDDILRPVINQLPRTMSARQMGKKSNHGLNYDEGYNTFALINEIEIAESKRIINLYHTIYPGIRQWYESTKRQLSKDRSLTNCFGRKIHFFDAWGDTLFKAAYSALPQSSVADCTNIGLRDIYNSDLTDLTAGTNLDIIAQVHDSILMQVPISILSDNRFYDVARRVYEYVSPEMQYNSRTFKIFTDSKIGFNWAGYHPEQNPIGMQEVVLNDNPEDFIRKVRSILNVPTRAE